MRRVIRRARDESEVSAADGLRTPSTTVTEKRGGCESNRPSLTLVPESECRLPTIADLVEAKLEAYRREHSLPDHRAWGSREEQFRRRLAQISVDNELSPLGHRSSALSRRSRETGPAQRDDVSELGLIGRELARGLGNDKHAQLIDAVVADLQGLTRSDLEAVVILLARWLVEAGMNGRESTNAPLCTEMTLDEVDRDAD